MGHAVIINKKKTNTHTHTHTHTHTLYDSSGLPISPTHRTLPDNTQHSQQIDIYVQAGFEPTVSAGERQQIHTLHCAATGIGKEKDYPDDVKKIRLVPRSKRASSLL